MSRERVLGDRLNITASTKGLLTGIDAAEK